MKTLKLDNFKAHEKLHITLDEKNLLVYGDNGSGKSSIYEALKFLFFKLRLEKKSMTSPTEEAQKEQVAELHRSFNNKKSKKDFELNLNDISWKTFDSTNYSPYMLTMEEIKVSDYILLKPLLDGAFFTFEPTIHDQYQKIIDKSNEYLKHFLEDITLEIDEEDKCIKITDTARDLTNIKNVKVFFNEAKLNLVVLLILFSAIEISHNHNKKNILILDDFITSLDMANRTFLMKHILETFKAFQIIILTHSVNFNNLLMYMINEKVTNNTKKWRFVNLYEVDNTHKHYIQDDRVLSSDIRSLYETEKAKPSPNYAGIGNQLRQKFERILYEFSKILMIGGVEESNKILENIAKHGHFYHLKEGSDFKTINDLVNEIDVLTDFASVKALIQKYKSTDLNTIKEILTTLKLYRKVTMHSLSHGRTGVHEVQPKEIEKTLDLIERLESNIKDLTKSVD